MSNTINKPATPNTTRTSSTSNAQSPLSRSPSRLARQTPATSKAPVSASSSAPGIARAQSVRSNNPPSARAAVRKAAESNTSMEELRSEMQTKLDELQALLEESQKAQAESEKSALLFQAKFNDAFTEQGLLEEKLHEHTERVEELENARRESERARKELEQIYESERVAALREREENQSKQSEMDSAMHNLRDTLKQRDSRLGITLDDRPSPTRGQSFRTSSPGIEGQGQFAPSSVERSDSRSSSKLVMQKDRIIESLRMELAEAQIRIVELENLGGGQMQEVQRQIYEVKIQNARLMEENESFQLLLDEKTLNGDFAQNRLINPRSVSTNSIPLSQSAKVAGISLADELDTTEEATTTVDNPPKQQSEIDLLREQIKAQGLYINNIVSRLLQHDQFEHILDKTPDLMSGPNLALRQTAAAEKALPPPPPPKDVEPMGFLSRARSVIGGAARPPRPLSLAQPSTSVEPRITENPETAPSIPLGRTTSVRTQNTHRRTRSDWNASSLVSGMMRGPSPNAQGPLSPGLASPTRNSFISQMRPMGQRVPSNVSDLTNATTLDSTTGARDSKLSNRSSIISHRTSMTSNTGFATSDAHDSTESGVSELSNPSSPPRSVTSSEGRDTKPAGGAVMMGSKMRPLRLVQEASKEDELAKKNAQQANRGSWFGWMGPAKTGALGNPDATSKLAGPGS